MLIPLRFNNTNKITQNYTLIRPFTTGAEASLYLVIYEDIESILRITSSVADSGEMKINNMIQQLKSPFIIKSKKEPFVCVSNKIYKSNILSNNYYTNNRLYKLEPSQELLDGLFENSKIINGVITIPEYNQNISDSLSLIFESYEGDLVITNYKFHNYIIKQLIQPVYSNLPKICSNQDYILKHAIGTVTMEDDDFIMSEMIINNEIYSSGLYIHEIFEKADETFTEFINKNPTDDMLKPVLLQIALAIKELQEKLMIVHQDLHSDNILIKYTTDSVLFDDPDYGTFTFTNHIVKIIDFGFANSYYPGHEIQSRHIVVMKDDLLKTGLYNNKKFDAVYDLAFILNCFTTDGKLSYIIKEYKRNIIYHNSRPINTLMMQHKTPNMFIGMLLKINTL